MEKSILKGSETELPKEGSKKDEPSQKYSWLTDLVSAIFRPFRKRGKQKREINIKKTEVTKDKHTQLEISYKEERTTDD